MPVAANIDEVLRMPAGASHIPARGDEKRSNGGPQSVMLTLPSNDANLPWKAWVGGQFGRTST